MEFGIQIPDSTIPNSKVRFEIPRFQIHVRDSRVPRVPDWESRIAFQSRRVHYQR
ncbi:MAG: hypothetical protein IPJ30_24080 [Acidobacteria bacterium]|nr:hypothetical protein [Acidobacteriota bacterium]